MSETIVTETLRGMVWWWNLYVMLCFLYVILCCFYQRNDRKVLHSSNEGVVPDR